jgi:hypothetical protein
MDLRRLILGLTLCSALLPFANTFYAGYTVQRQQLIDTTQDSNAAYARKLAKSTDDFLQSALQQLAYTAKLLAEHMEDEHQLMEEATRLRLQTQSFNSVTIYNPLGTVLATSPETLQIKGRTLTSTAVQDSLRTQGPVISQAFMSTAGNLIIFLSQPIFSSQGDYLGAVGGSIYLKQESMLDKLLGEHFYEDGSYLYVVDKAKRIIYHPQSQRVGDTVTGNQAIDQAVSGHSGRIAITNSQGVPMLAGYAFVPSAGWGIVAQRPQSATLAPLDALMRTMLYKTLPLTVLLLLLIWWRTPHRPAAAPAGQWRPHHGPPGDGADHPVRPVLVLRSAGAEEGHAGRPGPAAQEHHQAAPGCAHRPADRPGQPPPPGYRPGQLCRQPHAVWCWPSTLTTSSG